MRGTWGKLQGAGSRAPNIDLTPAAMLGGGARRACPPRPPRAAGSSSPRSFQAVLHQVDPRRPGRIAHVISPELLEVLACPKCKQKVELTEDGTGLVCQADRLRYPRVDDIPVMLIDEAESF